MGAEEDGASTLKSWVQGQRLSGTQLSADGSSLTLDGTSLNASNAYEIAHESKTCRYTLASMYLQILDPNQALMAYRGACKKHGVKDPVKALDKPTVVGYFLGGQAEGENQDSAEAATDSSAVPKKPEETPPKKRSRDDDDHHHRRKSSSSREKEDRHHRSKRSKESHRDRDRRDERKRLSSSSHKESTKDKKKRLGTPMTNEQLFDKLNAVVDKRSETSKEAAEVQAALAASGFTVSAEDLKKYKDVTDTIMEIPVGNSASILRAAGASEGRDFTRVLDLYNETLKPSRPDANGKSSKSGSGSDRDKKKVGRPHLIGKKPIIILPKGMQPPITMLNGYDFFANATFVPRDVQLKKLGRANAGKGKNLFTRRVGKRQGGGEVEYELIDNPKGKLGDDLREWDRVVAVVVLGEAWQFKDWLKMYKDPVFLFSNSYGYYIGMEGDRMPKDISKWNVKTGKLNRDKRGLDSVTAASFWNGLDEWMAVHKPELLPKQDK
mmetsp:Transcript_18644/g.26305  ORF Transcript_18644/g.26305 Transcript_18644/m.26305 type:complete len:495 (+) Transcript_18644:27-1511(+)